MATTRLIAMHRNRGKSVADCLGLRLAYATNSDKTRNREYVQSYACNVRMADTEFLLSKMQYERQTGRMQSNDVIAYQLRQSFPAGEVTPELAQEIAYQTVMRLTKGKHAFVVATHVDKAHIHSHIIFNSTTLDCTHKFRDFLGSGRALRKISDRLCLENGLSIVLHPSKKNKHYGQWLGDDKPVNFREQLKEQILACLAQQPTSYEDFLQKMEQAGYEVKRGKRTGFRGAGQQRFLRLRSLGEDFSEENICKIIDKDAPIPEVKVRKKRSMQPPQMGLLIDVQKKLDEGKGAGYARWASIYNAKQMANALNFISENHFDSIEDLEQKAKDISAEFHAADAQRNAVKEQLQAKEICRQHVRNYHKCRPIYQAYKDSGWSKQYKLDHALELTKYRQSRDYFNEQGMKSLPRLNRLDEEIDALYAQKNQANTTYKDAKKRMQEINIAQQNITIILQGAPAEQSNPRDSQRTAQRSSTHPKSTRDDR